MDFTEYLEILREKQKKTEEENKEEEEERNNINPNKDLKHKIKEKYTRPNNLIKFCLFFRSLRPDPSLDFIQRAP